MNRVRLSLAALFTLLLASSIAFGSDPDVSKASRHDTSPGFSQMANRPSANGGGSNSQSSTARSARNPFSNPHSDPVASTFTGPLTSATAGTAFEGQSADGARPGSAVKNDNGLAYNAALTDNAPERTQESWLTQRL
jgi:hypothetical protein